MDPTDDHPDAAGLPRLYDDLAWLWPVLSPPEDYAAEAARLDELIRTRLGPGPKRVLELGAGGGHTLVHLAAADGPGHACVAVDRSEPMLAHCRTLIPGIQAVAGDMRSVRLGQRFDVVLLHDAVDYLTTPRDIRETLATVREHLVPGGIAMIAPTYTAEAFTDSEVADDTAATDAAEVTYFSYVHDPDPGDDTFEMILLYLIRPRAADGTPGRAQVIEDRHTCGLFGGGEWLAMMRTAGLTTEFVEHEDAAWSLFVGTEPGDYAGS
ncbi:MAG: class I SAM-dependent methyltransferase [Planctomycetota bacterium]